MNQRIINKKGFTLIELIVAIIILSIAITICFQAFNTVTRSWKQTYIASDSLQYGNYAMYRFSNLLNSMVYFDNSKKTYGFDHNKEFQNNLPTDSISFVTSSPYFLSTLDPLRIVPHRIRLFIENNDQGTPSLYSISIPANSQELDFIDSYKPEPFLISNFIQGMEVLFWNKENEEWVEIWENKTRIPNKIMLTIHIVTPNNEQATIFNRIFNIPASEGINVSIVSPTTLTSAQN